MVRLCLHAAFRSVLAPGFIDARSSLGGSPSLAWPFLVIQSRANANAGVGRVQVSAATIVQLHIGFAGGFRLGSCQLINGWQPDSCIVHPSSFRNAGCGAISIVESFSSNLEAFSLFASFFDRQALSFHIAGRRGRDCNFG